MWSINIARDDGRWRWVHRERVPSPSAILVCGSLKGKRYQAHFMFAVAIMWTESTPSDLRLIVCERMYGVLLLKRYLYLGFSLFLEAAIYSIWESDSGSGEGRISRCKELFRRDTNRLSVASKCCVKLRNCIVVIFSWKFLYLWKIQSGKCPKRGSGPSIGVRRYGYERNILPLMHSTR